MLLSLYQQHSIAMVTQSLTCMHTVVSNGMPVYSVDVDYMRGERCQKVHLEIVNLQGEAASYTL